VFECVEVALELIGLSAIELPLILFILTSLERLWASTELYIAEMLKEKNLLTISLLGTTIQDSGMKERSNMNRLDFILLSFFLFYFIFSFIFSFFYFGLRQRI